MDMDRDEFLNFHFDTHIDMPLNDARQDMEDNVQVEEEERELEWVEHDPEQLEDEQELEE